MASLGPKAVICYICGRKYGTSSITFHEPQCLKKWQMENRQLPKKMRRRPPVRPQGYGSFSQGADSRIIGQEIDAMNELSYESSKKQLIPCENCGRTFLPDRLSVHQRSCRPGNVHKQGRSSLGGGTKNSPSSGATRNGPRESPVAPVKPKTVVCYICGREFGTSSITIHEPQCLKKWSRENSSLPKNIRRPPPSKPDMLPSLSGNSEQDRERRNVLAYESAKQQLLPCPNCGRTFLPDRLQVHLKSCRSPPKTMPELQNNKFGGDFNNNNVRTTKQNSQLFKPQKPKTALKPKTPLSQLNKGKQRFKKPEQYSRESPDSFLNSRPPSQARPHLQKKQSAASSTGGFGNSEQFGNAGGAGDSGGSSGMDDVPQYGSDGNLVACFNCGRKFAADRVEKHQSVCSKTKQRKVFNASKKRVEGTELATYNKPGRGGTRPVAKPKSNWKQKHEEFIRAIRDAKKVQQYVKDGGNLSDLPPPPASENPDYVYCKHCTRRFAPETAARHIPKCATTANRPKPPKQRALPLGRGSNRTSKYR